MGEAHVITALERKRAVISGELAEAEKRCRAMRDYLAALDNTLRLFGYDCDPAAIKPVRPRLDEDRESPHVSGQRTAGISANLALTRLDIITMEAYSEATPGIMNRS
jgi:hypothetical protein